MKNLLRFEFRKLLQRKSTYVLLAVQLAVVFAYTVLIRVAINFIGDDLAFLMGITTSDGVNVMLAALPSAGVASVLLGIFTAMFCCEDRGNDALKNIYARGYTPGMVLFAELIAVIAYSLIFCLASILVGFVSGAALFQAAGTFTGKTAAMLSVQFACMLAYTCFFFMFAKVLQKTGSSIAANLAIPVGLSAVLTVADLALMTKNISVSKYWLDGAMSAVVTDTCTTKDMLVSLAVAAVVLTLSLVIGYFANRKRPA